MADQIEEGGGSSKRETVLSGGSQGDDLPVIRKRSEFWYRFMTGIFIRNLKKQFYAIHVLNLPEEVPDDRALICCMNHPSWNDPMVGAFLHDRFFRKREAYAPIEEQALEGYPVLRKIGLYGVNRGNAGGARRFLRESDAILRRGRTAIWITAQGHFADVRLRPVLLEPGLGFLLGKTRAKFRLLPVALEYTYGEEKLPEVFVNFGEPIAAPELGKGTPADWKSACEKALEAAQDELAERVMARQAGDFETLLGGQAGVGGVYGLWRRLRAVIRGENYDPSHGSLTS